jgi:3-oxoacyl-[acyl-carrier-protein] synthase-3
MKATQPLPLPYRLIGIATLIGKVISIDEWAERARVPNRKAPGILDGATIERLLGIEAKSWDPELFGRIETIAMVARQALRSARVAPAEIDAVIVVTCSPYEILLDQDAFRLMRMLGIPDQVPPLQLGAGCAGLARAAAIAARLQAERALIITYSLPSCVTGDGRGGVGEHYLHNTLHPLGPLLWASPGIFSDAAAALVLRRHPESNGLALYCRDSQSFGDDEPGFTDPLIHYLGGGAQCPPDGVRSVALSCYGMQGEAVKRYYTKGMMLNHHALLAARPDYVGDVRRIYTHQASPALVDSFAKLAGLSADQAPSNARQYGNLVSPCTAKMLHDDLAAGRLADNDTICVSVVGAGPERGAFLLPVAVAELMHPGA